MCQRIRGCKHLFLKSVSLDYITDGAKNLVSRQWILCSTFWYSQKPGGGRVLVLTRKFSVGWRVPGSEGKGCAILWDTSSELVPSSFRILRSKYMRIMNGIIIWVICYAFQLVRKWYSNSIGESPPDATVMYHKMY